jgi:hypothetical protein
VHIRIIREARERSLLLAEQADGEFVLVKESRWQSCAISSESNVPLVSNAGPFNS